MIGNGFQHETVHCKLLEYIRIGKCEPQIEVFPESSSMAYNIISSNNHPCRPSSMLATHPPATRSAPLPPSDLQFLPRYLIPNHTLLVLAFNKFEIYIRDTELAIDSCIAKLIRLIVGLR